MDITSCEHSEHQQNKMFNIKTNEVHIVRKKFEKYNKIKIRSVDKKIMNLLNFDLSKFKEK